ncbi:MAG: sensor histidine kinase [Candidatus Latescibacterota bacterium]|jgi:signal transduction histidine kinase
MLEAGMEHEFKNNLMSITPNAEMLHSGMLGPLDDLQKETVGSIMDAGNALLDSLTQRLEFSRAYSGSLDLKRDAVDLYDMARHTFAQLAVAYPQERFLLEGQEYDAESTRPRGICADADASYLARVFNNLVGNAVKYSSWVGVRIERLEGCISVEVEDGGEGIDADDYAGIWSLGYRAKNRKGGSTGIGSPNAKLIVEAHGGHIGVRSTLGRGSTFFFTLPRSAGDHQS